MSSYVIFRGVSGAEYSYMPLTRAPLLKGRSGNYVVARHGEAGAVIASAGETADLGLAPWGEPGADETVLVRFNVGRAAREAELSDLLPAISTDGIQSLRPTG